MNKIRKQSCQSIPATIIFKLNINKWREKEVYSEESKNFVFFIGACDAGVAEKEAHNKVDGICNTCGFEPKLMLSSAEIDSDTTEVVFVFSVENNPGILCMELA